MKKSDLKSGMLIKTAKGNYGIVMLNTPQGDSIVRGNNPDGKHPTWFPMYSIEENIGDSLHESYRIVEVWSYSTNSQACDLSTSGRKLLWKPGVKEHLIAVNKTCHVYLDEESGRLDIRAGRTVADTTSIPIKEAVVFIEDLRKLDETGCLKTASLNKIADFEVTADFCKEEVKIGCQTVTFDSLYKLLDLIK